MCVNQTSNATEREDDGLTSPTWAAPPTLTGEHGGQSRGRLHREEGQLHHVTLVRRWAWTALPPTGSCLAIDRQLVINVSDTRVLEEAANIDPPSSSTCCDNC